MSDELCSTDTAVETVPQRLDWRLMLPVFIIVSLDAASSGAILPILPFFLRELGASPLLLGFVLGAEALSQFVAAPWLGQLSDRFGRKRILLASQAGALVSLLLLALAGSVVFVLLARILLGLTAANFSAAAAYAADNSSPATRRQAIGLLSAGLGLGGMIGSSLSGYLADISLTAPIWAALGLSAASLCVTGLWLRGAHPPGRLGDDGEEAGAIGENISFRTLLASPVIRVLIVVLLCHYFSYGMFSSQLAVFLQDTFSWNEHAFGPKELGYLLTADGAINIFVQFFLLKWLGASFSERGLIVLVFAILAIGYVAAGLAADIPTLAFSVLLISTGVALARPTFVAALSVHVPRRRQGVVMGATQSLVAVTEIVTPVLAGVILGQSLYGAWIGAVVAITLTGAVIAGSRLRRIDPETTGG
ncbi:MULTISPECIES: MFS transporter [unclassified Rhizobium]|uniref:MFS transporter n=1 Tax=unclassified Rhizobium TaxID=2613769 RepID=UPI0007E9E878|nr:MULTISPECIES: MFS transporter [unclassified Rhizobium]ANM10527.1 major facilitator superfamily protein [Rhizobium sp. N324]ANM17041.1 major facilitator superfamily protein [Rhizobium sp. N541]ANM23426.1 major facilitator superfamily protein [Rhizobium sp. N941]OYD04128.1 major facilitator superfamily protein [Rhizobium sp. N4311]